MNKYDHTSVEKSVQKRWEETKPFLSDYTNIDKKENFYLLDMFPYPSGDGLHMGHTEGYTATDILYRFKKLQGYNVLHPQGFDSFGLPAENYAIKTGTHPVETTKSNATNYIRQWKSLGLGHDFDNLVYTSDASFYKWTQWIFGQMMQNDMAYRAHDTVNWCSSCNTTIANEQVIDGACERCDTDIEQREIPSWSFRITDFADELIDDLDDLDWPEHTKKKQINWIGKSEGAEIDFKLVESEYVDVNRDGGADSYQDGVEEVERFNVVVIIEHPNEEKYLCAQWKQVDWKGFVTGGIEHADSIEETALKEVQEETGYQNPEIVKVYEQSSHGKFYHVGKEINRFAHYRIVHVKLQDLEQKERSAEEQAIADMVWVDKADVADFVTREDMRYPWRVVMGEDTLEDDVTVFTTRADTLYGVTYLALAPEHSLISKYAPRIKNLDEVNKYIDATKKKTELERLESKEKTGVKLEGISGVNPANGELIPVYITDYVLNNYGTGAIMAVPAHDERDNEFASKFDISIKQVVQEVFNEQEEVEFERSAAYGIIKKDDKYLIQYFKKRDFYWFPGGGIERDESPEEGLIRELREETPYENFRVVSNSACVGLDFLTKKTNVIGRNNGHFFLVELENDARSETSLTETEVQEDISLEWMTLSELRDLAESNIPGRTDMIKAVVDLLINQKIFNDYGFIVNSDEFDGLTSDEAKEKIVEKVGGRMKSTYRLRDWSISRQRYWGTPIPVVYDPEGKAHYVGDENLPWTLPTDVDFVPTGTAPLQKSEELHKRTEELFGEGWKPEVDTMDTFVDSSWYYLRYPDPHNDSVFCSKEMLEQWLPVDLYIGGAEHTYMHLLYARYIAKALNKLGLVSFDEPFKSLRHQGMVNDEHGKKMSKSKGNVVNPDDMIEKYGADTVRTFMMFAAPLEDDVMWNEKNIIGTRRFLEKVWSLQEKVVEENNTDIDTVLHKTIKGITEQIRELKLNTPVSDMMKLVNEMQKCDSVGKDQYFDLLTLLSPYAPHMTETLALNLCGKEITSWSTFDESKLVEDSVTLGVQVNGKRRGDITIAPGASEEDAMKAASADDGIKKHLDAGNIVKVIYVPGRILNIVVK